MGDRSRAVSAKSGVTCVCFCTVYLGPRTACLCVQCGQCDLYLHSVLRTRRIMVVRSILSMRMPMRTETHKQETTSQNLKLSQPALSAPALPHVPRHLKAELAGVVGAALHSGHDGSPRGTSADGSSVLSSQASIQRAWNSCKHGSARSSSFSAKASRQMAHSPGSAAAARRVGSSVTASRNACCTSASRLPEILRMAHQQSLTRRQ